MERRLGPGDGILGERAIGLHHLVEGADSVANFELCHACADAVDVAGDVVSGVHWREVGEED
jgi:hypothetical protein